MKRKLIVLLTIPLLMASCGKKEEAEKDNTPEYKIQESYDNKSNLRTKERKVSEDDGDKLTVTQNGKKVTINTNDYYSSDARMLEPGDAWVVTGYYRISVNSTKPANTTSVVVSYNVENLSKEAKKFIPKTVVDQDFNVLEPMDDKAVPTIQAGEKVKDIKVTYKLKQPNVDKLQVIFSQQITDSQKEDAVFTSLFEK